MIQASNGFVGSYDARAVCAQEDLLRRVVRGLHAAEQMAAEAEDAPVVLSIVLSKERLRGHSGFPGRVALSFRRVIRTALEFITVSPERGPGCLNRKSS